MSKDYVDSLVFALKMRFNGFHVISTEDNKKVAGFESLVRDGLAQKIDYRSKHVRNQKVGYKLTRKGVSKAIEATFKKRLRPTSN